MLEEREGRSTQAGGGPAGCPEGPPSGVVEGSRGRKGTRCRSVKGGRGLPAECKTPATATARAGRPISAGAYSWGQGWAEPLAETDADSLCPSLSSWEPRTQLHSLGQCARHCIYCGSAGEGDIASVLRTGNAGSERYSNVARVTQPPRGRAGVTLLVSNSWAFLATDLQGGRPGRGTGGKQLGECVCESPTPVVLGERPGCSFLQNLNYEDWMGEKPPPHSLFVPRCQLVPLGRRRLGLCCLPGARALQAAAGS